MLRSPPARTCNTPEPESMHSSTVSGAATLGVWGKPRTYWSMLASDRNGLRTNPVRDLMKEAAIVEG